ncbi:Phosphohistidine phosphatase SixA [uncultured Rubrobacteraceae bacterium]|uniref:Phosphohistidine phosphatase SixA n=1 Tax=uncultured Rubrobacteraceae bacterium TaxID=349277 RepID=A0A6J4PT39_9ACTN|nr:Phosphohistidine phosphatase SixA [uncultured Rubrobacteraceae bacterium]
MYLYLVRHAVAYGRDPERWPDDRRRPLTPEGEEDFREAARGLVRVAPEVETLLGSPYERAWRTAEILAECAGWPAPEAFPALEPDVPPEKVVLALETYAGKRSIALAGHRPCLHELAVYLLTGDAGGADMKIKKGGVACIEFDDAPEAGAGKLRWLFTPRVLRTLAVGD